MKDKQCNTREIKADVAIDRVLAGIAVNDFASAVTWYERLLGWRADAAPMEGLAEWHFSEYGGIQLIQDEDRAGSSYVTLVVTSLNDQLAALKAEGIPVGPTQGTPGLVKAATVTDPEGNRVTFTEDLADKNQDFLPPSSMNTIHKAESEEARMGFGQVQGDRGGRGL